MPLMTQIRNNLTKAFAIFAAFFIVYIVLDWGMDITGRKHNEGSAEIVGMVNDTKINYREFSELLRQQTENIRKQSGNEVDEETERQIRTQVWNGLIQQALVEQELERLGITVTDNEIRDILLGPNPPEMVANQFKDSTGVFNRAAYDRAVADPQNRSAWIQLEDQIRRQRRIEKLQSALFAAIRVSEGELRQRFADKTVTADAEYVLFDPNRFFPDSAIQVTDADIQKHYNENQEDFKVRAARKLKYVFFSLAPSATDSAAVIAEMNRNAEQAKVGSDFTELAKTYSEVPINDTVYVKHGELSKMKETAVFAAKKGQIIGPLQDFDGYHLIKIIDEKKGKTEFVRASHILLNLVSGPDSVAKIQKAKDLLKKAKSGANFGQLARENSDDFGSKVQDGDLGWTGKGGWVKPFEDAARKANVGDIVGPIRSQFGWHIIKVTGKDSRELKLVTLTMRVKASSQSADVAYQRAQDFAVLAKDEGFEKSAELSSYQVRETPEFTKSGFVPGIGVNDAVQNFAFGKKLNTVSEPMSVSSGIAVFKVSAITEEGVRPLEDVRLIVRSQVVRSKKMQKIREQVDAFYKTLGPTSDLMTAAQSLQNVTAQKTGSFKATDAPAGAGRDYAFIGTTFSLNAGRMSKPFEGSRGYYIIKLLSKTPFDSTQFTNERASLRDQILQEKRNRVFSEWLNALREKAAIEDHRDKFYR